MPICLISLGSNLGDRQESLDAAVALLTAHPQIKLLAQSTGRETSPVGGPAGQGDFLNVAVKIETSLAPRDLLACLQQIENQLGRRRDERWGARTIDLDLLLYDEQILDTPELVVPHPRMAWRRFVLEPAAEVGGSMIHPTTGWSVARLLEHLKHSPSYVAIAGPIAAGKTQLAERLCKEISGQLILEQPDWKRLDAFYADPASHAWETELEFLDERTRLLTPNDAVCRRQYVPTQSMGMSETPFFCVSDFWFDQSAAFARAWLPTARLATFLERFEQLRQTVVMPRLIVLLDAPAEELLARVRRRGRECERHLTVDALARIRQSLLDEANRPDIGPVLRAGSADSETVFAEVLAAVQAIV
jgi:2-amino-4-hydroxy-6-hydroxymethyldihydropteridine diphosphokinase